VLEGRARGYQGMIAQAAFGVAANWVVEFAPGIKRMLPRNKSGGSGNKKGSSPTP
jgi:hypothetical protein